MFFASSSTSALSGCVNGGEFKEVRSCGVQEAKEEDYSYTFRPEVVAAIPHPEKKQRVEAAVPRLRKQTGLLIRWWSLYSHAEFGADREGIGVALEDMLLDRPWEDIKYLFDPEGHISSGAPVITPESL
ncbi:hypothetical protein Nepgr_026578 [Nepenthes gracilis]|uniref:Uncharacterized protein n=1 Tax=Nepenthes gracilis TaxID=150966 RepID=A0AAD3Y259_NEPGR|nr:hypothetical protein Nepgr_026578 [Nepenthes gracilis]